ncbi:MAG: SH3 domain-containing protein [Clostridiales bacterium]|nr:SH3 domain-containing protein [Clostridiales bacterium]
MCKKVKVALLWVLIAVLAVLAAYCWGMAIQTAYAEDDTWSCWAVCQPGSWVCVRTRPSLGATVIGRVLDGQQLTADAYTENGWYHIIDLPLEQSEGWICMNYLSDEEPTACGGAVWTVVANGRVAVREGMGGECKMWIQPGAEVEVHMLAGEWAVTSCGFIRAKYLVAGHE